MFQAEPLPYDYNALEPYIDTETMHLHYDKHYNGYIKNLNDALASLEDGGEKFFDMSLEEIVKNLDQIPQDVRTKVKNNAGGALNHAMFWKTMSPEGGEPTGALLEAINKTFGDIAAFQAELNKACLGVFGSGWGWLVLNQGKLEIVSTPNQDSPYSSGQIPIMGIDVWEHAYYLKYHNLRQDYLTAWWNVANWPEMEKRFDEAS